MADASTFMAGRTAQDSAEPAGRGAEGTSQASEDLALCEQIARGDVSAFELLVTRYQHRVYGYCLRFIGDSAEAEDLAQDVFLTVFKNAGAFRGEAQLSTWLFRIARNRALNRLKYLERRGRSARRALSVDGEAREGLAFGDEDRNRPDRAFEAEETAAIVKDAIATLEVQHREVLILRDVEDLSYEEIAEVTGLPIGTVKSRIHRGRSVLTERLLRIFK